MAERERVNIPEHHTWNLEPLFRSDGDWESAFLKVEATVDSISQFKGKLSEGAETVASLFETKFSFERSLERLYTYAHLRSDEDTRNTFYLGLVQRVSSLYSRFAALASFTVPELLSLPDPVLTHYLQSPALAPYLKILEDIVRYKPHTLTTAEETILAEGLEIYGSTQIIFSQLNNADLRFKPVVVDGEKKPLTHGSFVTFLRSADRKVRETAYQQYYDSFEQVKNTLAATLTSNAKKDWYIARVRKFNAAINRSLFADNIDVAIYDSLIQSVSDNLAPLHRYYKLRKRLLRLEEQRLFDTYVPLVPAIEMKHSFEQACELVCNSMTPLGELYVDTLRKGLLSARWVDVYENRGKRSGAYSSGCYDSPPYILINFKEESLNDIFTLAHEAGHSMHSYYSRKHQPYHQSDYTIFVAEVASTFNEQLLVKHLREQYGDNKSLQAYLINQQIDDIKATFFRQTMFAEFERAVHAQAARNLPITLDFFTANYRELLVKYFGDAVVITERDALECLRIPHFYSSFYVYKYATGLAAAISLSSDILSGTDTASYMAFLSAGSSKYPLELLADAGVDLRTNTPIEKTVTLFSSLLDQLEKLLS